MPLIEVTGTVDRLVWEGKAIRFWEQYVGFNGDTKNRIWTAWFDSSMSSRVQEGDNIVIKGDLTTKVGEWMPKDATEPRQIVEHSLNNCQLIEVTAATPKTAPAASQAVPEDAPF